MKIHNITGTYARSVLELGILVLLVICCSAVAGDDDRFSPLPRDNKNVPKPQFTQYNMFGNCLTRLTAETHWRFFDVSRHIRRITGRPIQAMNCDSFGEVPDCSWFTNRNERNPLSLKAIARGAHTGDGPDTVGEWLVIKAKTDGMSPGFWIKDSRGDRYIIKFDPRGYPELTTGAEVISSKILYAAGYNVPENYVTVFNPAKVILSDKMTFTDSLGCNRAMNRSDLEGIFKGIQQQPDGMIRAHASKFISGTPVGSFRFVGMRPDDPNDFIPHEHRRELRGLLVISSWIQHYDNNLSNTFDSYVVENGCGYVKHYLIDFGGTFGGSMHGPQPNNYCNENVVDLPKVITRLLTFGLYRKKWEQWDTIPYLSIGTWESTTFKPRKYRFNTPVESMENMTEQDAFWGAKIVMSFTDDQIDVLVGEGRYSDREAEAYVAKILKERRDKIGREYYSRVCPLDNFCLKAKSDSAVTLHFEDLMVRGNLALTTATDYRCVVADKRGAFNWKRARRFDKTSLTIPAEQVKNHGGHGVVLAIQSRYGNRKWSSAVQVHLHPSATPAGLVIAGVQHN